MSDLQTKLQATLGANYTLERELGGGGMSTVFVARDNLLSRSVVVKVLPYELAATVSVDRFKREIMLSAGLQHPHIVPVLSAGETDGLPFFIMPFVEGESLRARLGRGPLSIRETVSMLKDVGRALSFAHGRGIIHRDIKPDNILMSSGSATVTDFGVAKAISASREGVGTSGPSRTITHIGTSIGTPAYMAPEQAAGDPATDHRADLYALGIVGYEALVGTPPFHGRTPQQLLAAQLTEPPSPIEARRYDVSPALASLIMRLLKKNPADRPKTASDVIRSLDDPDIVSGTFASAERPSRRSRIVLWIAAAAVVLLAASGWYLWRQPGSTTAPKTPALNGIAVAPFATIGGDSADAHFADGVTAEVSTALSKLPAVRVAPQSAANAASGKGMSPVDIAKTLNVQLLLEGTTQRDGKHLRVTARLIRLADDVTLWSDVYDRPSGDVFTLQDEVSTAIAGSVSTVLTKRDSSGRG